jgi:hypothetical protein
MYASPATTPPFGSFDTPAPGSTAQGSIAVTGWALDDIEVTRVEIWRDWRPGERAPAAGNGKVFIATPLFVSGARPDIEYAYASLPLSHRAGWGYLLLTQGLSSLGDGQYTLWAYAFDADGRSTTLGSKVITVTNGSSTKPFGALDTPTYGQTVSGSFWNFGWALTPGACTITDGNVLMGVDSGPLVPVTYGGARPDILAAFGTFSNGSNSGGAYYLDTTTLANGTHSIGWYVIDSCGHSDGIGSRFFTVQNSGGDVFTSGAAAERPALLASLGAASGPDAVSEPIDVRRADGLTEFIYPSTDGTRIVEVREGERIEVRLPRRAGGTYAGAHVLNGLRHGLPAGSSLDARAGIFYSQPAAGFLGSFDLWFGPDGSASGSPVRVRVVVGPPLRMAVDTPTSGFVREPFMLQGWALDLAAAAGSGIDTVHVWAYPHVGGAPIFLGVAATGDERADVAAVYGPQFGKVSFALPIGSLRSGSYDLVVYAHRASTGSFDGAQIVRVRIP